MENAYLTCIKSLTNSSSQGVRKKYSDQMLLLEELEDHVNSADISIAAQLNVSSGAFHHIKGELSFLRCKVRKVTQTVR